MGIYNGNNLRVYVGGTLVANNQSCSVELQISETEQNSKDDGGWVTARVTRKRVIVSAEHLFDEVDTGISAILTSGFSGSASVTLLVGETSPSAGEISISGTFNIANIGLNADTDQDGKGNWTFNSTGPVTYTVGSD